MYRHASTQGQATFASFTNLMGKEIEYAWSPNPTVKQEVDLHTHEVRRAHKALARGRRRPGIPTAKAPAATPAAAAAVASANQCPKSLFPLPEASPLPGWQAAFLELSAELPGDLEYAAAVSHVRSRGLQARRPGCQSGREPVPHLDQCEGCHEAGGAGQLATPNMVERVGDQQIDLAPWAE